MLLLWSNNYIFFGSKTSKTTLITLYKLKNQPTLSTNMNTTHISLLALGGTLELLGILTLITNPESILPHAEFGFTIPTLISPDIQGITLLAIGAILTTTTILKMQKKQ